MDHSKISFGKIAVPLDDFAIQGNAVLGIRESGKSYTSTYAGERLMDAGIPITGIDPIGVWHNLRIPGAGKSYPVVVVGGQHGDLPLTPASAESTMRAAMAAGVSIIFDLYDVKLSKRDWRDIVVAIVKVLLFENKDHGLRHVFIEEAPEFVPQKVGPDQGMVYSFVERLVRMGGNANLGVTLIGQRAEEMNKAVLELCDLLVLHRQKGRRSLENLSKWIELAAPGIENDVAATVPILKNGEAYVWPRGEATPVRTKIPEKQTFHPDRRQRHKAAVAETKRMDAGEFVAKMKAEIDKAAQAGVAALQGKMIKDALDGKSSRIVLGSEITAKVNAAREQGKSEGLHEGTARGYQQAMNEFSDTAAELRRVAVKLEDATQELRGLADGIDTAAANTAARFGTSVTARPQVKAAQRAMNSHATKARDAVGIPPGELTVMRAVAMYEAGVDRAQLSILTGYKRSTRDRYVQFLSGKGWVVVAPDSTISITAAGIEALGSNYEPLPTGGALRDFWLSRLPEGERKLFERVLQAWPQSVDRGELSAHSGYKRSTRDRYLQYLQSRKIVQTTGDGQIKASEVLFQ